MVRFIPVVRMRLLDLSRGRVIKLLPAARRIFQTAACGIPVGQYAALQCCAVEGEVMQSRAVGVAMDEQGAIVLAEKVFHGRLVHIHDFLRFLLLGLFALHTHAFNESNAFSQWLLHKHVLDGRRVNLLTKRLVFDIVRAKEVAVRQTDGLSAQFNSTRVVQQRG